MPLIIADIDSAFAATLLMPLLPVFAGRFAMPWLISPLFFAASRLSIDAITPRIAAFRYVTCRCFAALPLPRAAAADDIIDFLRC